MRLLYSIFFWFFTIWGIFRWIKMSCSNLSSFLLLFGCVRCVMTVNLTLLLSFTQFYWFDRELCSVCAYVLQVLPSFSNIIYEFRFFLRLLRFVHRIFFRSEEFREIFENWDVLSEFIKFFCHFVVAYDVLRWLFCDFC